MTWNIAPLTASAVLALSVGVLAQSPPSPVSHIPQPKQAEPKIPRQEPASQPESNGRDKSQKDADETTTTGQLTITGCVEREADYRAAHDQGKGGPGGSGLGQGNEYVLTHATSGNPVPTSGSAPTESLTYLLTGPAEKDAGPFVNRRVELSGKFKDTAGESGLKVFEVSAVRVANGSCD